MGIFVPVYKWENRISVRLERLRWLTFMYYNTSINWKAVSTNIKSNEWFHVRVFWNNSLINQKHHIIGYLNPYWLSLSVWGCFTLSFHKRDNFQSKLDSPFLIRWNYSCHIIIKGYVTDRNVYLDYIRLFFWFSENCSFWWICILKPSDKYLFFI